LLKRRTHDIGIIHLFGLGPHVAKHLADVAIEHAFELRRDRAAHGHERVDREERIEGEPRDGVLW
jgi:hypothetical protein